MVKNWSFDNVCTDVARGMLVCRDAVVEIEG